MLLLNVNALRLFRGNGILKMLESNCLVRRAVSGLLLAASVVLADARCLSAQEITHEELPAPAADAPAEERPPAEPTAPAKPTAASTLSLEAPAQADGAAQAAAAVGAGSSVNGMEPLLRGPVHEAFAEPVTLESAEPLVVAKEPPPAIEEVPPAEKPEGTDVAWIPGYWSWDVDRDDYVWVSGVWRKIPQGRAWVAGKWEKVDTGFQWVAGRWMPTAQLDAASDPLPVPPATLELGPNQDAPSEQHFWIPGCWQYREQRYAWRPGFWSPCYENWVWVPDHYVPVMGGCVFVPGYWDYGWERRGVLYAPCVVDRTLVYRPGFQYTPSIAVNVTDSFFHLWVRPSYRHYYFGDYYDSRYSNWGFMPWYAYHRSSAWAYDPLFVHYRWRFGRDNVDLRHHLYHQHDYYRSHIQDRPVHYYRDGHPGHDRDRDFATRPDGHPGNDRHHDRVLGYNRHEGSHAAGFASRDDLRRAVLERQNDPALVNNQPLDSGFGRPDRSGSPDAFRVRDRFSSDQSVDNPRRQDWDADLPRARLENGRNRGDRGERGRPRDLVDVPQGNQIVNPRSVPNQVYGERGRIGGENQPRDLGGVGSADTPNARPGLTFDELRQRAGRDARLRSSFENRSPRDGNVNRLGTDSLRGRDRGREVGGDASVGPPAAMTQAGPSENSARTRMERFESLRAVRPEVATPDPSLSAPRRGNDFSGQLMTPRGRLNSEFGRGGPRDASPPQFANPRSIPQPEVRSDMMRGRGDMGRVRSEAFRPPAESRGSFERSRPDFGRAAGPEMGRGNFGGGDAMRAARGGGDGGGPNLPRTPKSPGGGGRGRGGRD